VNSIARLSADDMATLREGQFLAAALAAQRSSGTVRSGTPGRCAFCQAACLPLAVYCDPDCQAEHERRQQILRRQGRG
jgi:hypothetical protein